MTAHARRCCFRMTVIVAALLAQATRVEACAVCFGDPDSRMAKGVVAGVIVLVGVVSVVLLGIAGTGLFWVHRSRRLAASNPEATAEGGFPD